MIMQFASFNMGFETQQSPMVHTNATFEDTCPSLTAMLCPEIIRLINDYGLSDERPELTARQDL
jgi:hypothetical protein